MQLIPAIDLKEGQCVRLRQGKMDDDTVFSDDPVAMAARWVEAGCRRLHLVDLNGAFAGEPVNGRTVEDMTVAANTGMKLSLATSGSSRLQKIREMRRAIAAVRDVTDRQETMERLALLRDRERIGRDIHDMVIQRIFAAGMSIQAAAGLVDSPDVRDRLNEVTDGLDETIRQLRTAIFQLTVHSVETTVTEQIRQIVYDPWLPGPLVDAQARRACVDTVRRFDRVGHQLWRRLYETTTGAPGPWAGAARMADTLNA